MYDGGEAGGGHMARMESSSRQRAYRSARSHSGRVRFAKIAMPTVAAIAILAAAGWMWISRVAPDIGLDLASTSISGGKLVVANPRLDGLTSGDLPYSVRAERAIQDLSGGGGIDLERLEADVPMTATVTARILADSGRYDSDAGRLDLFESITVETTDGMNARLQSASIDLEKGSMTTSDPVSIDMRGGSIRADSLTIENSGRRLLFENSVKLVVEPDKFRPADLPGRPGEDAGAQTGN